MSKEKGPGNGNGNDNDQNILSFNKKEAKLPHIVLDQLNDNEDKRERRVAYNDNKKNSFIDRYLNDDPTTLIGKLVKITFKVNSLTYFLYKNILRDQDIKLTDSEVVNSLSEDWVVIEEMEDKKRFLLQYAGNENKYGGKLKHIRLAVPKEGITKDEA